MMANTPRFGARSATEVACRCCGAAVTPPVASRQASPPPWLAQVCDALVCQARAREAEMSRVLSARARALERQVSGAGVVGFVPVNERELGRSSINRHRAFQLHLEQMIDDAMTVNGSVVTADAELSGSAPLSPLLSPTLAQTDSATESSSPDRRRDLAVVETACSACRGFCCTTAGTHAWITPATIRRVQMAFPQIGREELVARYRSQLPARSYRDSCVYHGSGGCRLEGALRSETCHRYVCDGVTSLVALVRARGAAGVRVAAAVDSRVVRVASLPSEPVAICPDGR